jgi:hypothetical protein
MRFRQTQADLFPGDIYHRRIGDAAEIAEVIEVGPFGFALPHVKFRTQLMGHDADSTKVLSVAVFLERYLPSSDQPQAGQAA